MAQWMTPTEEQVKSFAEWRATRPKVVQDLIDKLPMWTLFMLKETRHRCTIYSYNEDGTVSVAITGGYNLINYGRRVFGIHPEDLVECDLPAPGELVGALFNKREQLDHINKLRADNGLDPLTMEQMEAIKRSLDPMCA